MFTDKEIEVLEWLVEKEIERVNVIIEESKARKERHKRLLMTNYKEELKYLRKKFIS